MNWLTPAAGAILAALVIPPLVLLYFLKLKRRTQAVACTLLWKRAIEDLRANSPFQRLRKSLLLLLQLIALILLALAIMQPQFQAGARRGGNTVILIDNSASMTATDIDGTTRLEDAKRQAKERIEQLYGGGIFGSSAGQTMIITFSDQAQIISRFTDSKPQLLNSIDSITPTHGKSMIGDALNFARAYTTIVNPEAGLVSHDTTLELYSDGKLADLSDQVLRGEELVYYPIGTDDADNVAITAISIERPYDRPDSVEVFVSLVNFNTDPIICDVQLSVDGLVRAIEEVSINGAAPDPVTGEILPERSNIVFTPFEQPRGAVIEIANLREDDLAADNAARLVVPPPKLLKIALVEPVGEVVKSVLQGMNLASIDAIVPDDFEQIAKDEGVDNYDVVIFVNYAPAEGSMPTGRYLSFGKVPPLKGLNRFGEGGSAIILDTKDEHPVFRFVNLDKLYFSKSQLIQPDDDVQVLAETVDGPVIVAISRGSMQAIHVCIDPLDSNWPYLRSWVTFVVNAVEYLGNVGDALAVKGFSPGQALTARLPASANNIVLHEPDDSTHQLQPQDPTQLSWGPIRLAGVYGLDWAEPSKSDKQQRLFAVNLLSEPEGDIRPAKEIFTNEQSGVTVAGSGSSHYTPLWPWAIGVCLTVLMLEWWVYHRKAYI